MIWSAYEMRVPRILEPAYYHHWLTGANIADFRTRVLLQHQQEEHGLALPSTEASRLRMFSRLR